MVAGLFLQDGAFWEAIEGARFEWKIEPRRMLPSVAEHKTYSPVEPSIGSRGFDREKAMTVDRWDDTLKPLKETFIPRQFRRGGQWETFFGACVMCDPPDDRLHEFAEFASIFPRVFWPVVECELEDIDASGLRSMIAPPVELVWKRGQGGACEDGEQFAEYRIVVDEHTEGADVISAFRAIRAAYGLRNSGGRPGIDSLTAVQCAVLYDDHNGPVSDDRRERLWTYKKLAARFRARGVKNERSAALHVKRGRALRRNFRGA